MNKKQYIKVFRHMNSLIEIFRDEIGEKHVKKHKDFDCEFFIPTNNDSEFTDLINGQPLQKVKCNGYREFKEKNEQYKGVLTTFGTQRPEDQFRRYTYYNKETFLQPKVAWFDIETGFNGSYLDSSGELVSGEGGFPKPEEVNAPVTSIAIICEKRKVVFGLKDLPKEIPGVKYHKCENEEDMLETFFKLIKHWDIDVLNGWNTKGFDYPFLVNRMNKLGLDTKQIDHLGILDRDRMLDIEIPMSYYWMDYMEIYKKFTFAPRENFSLQFIAKTELGAGKVDYSDHGNLEDLYRGDFQKFIEYNIQDVQLLVDLDKKVNLMALTAAMSYLYNINFNNVFGTTGPWAQLIYCETRQNNNILPQRPAHSEDMNIEGGYVMSNPGFYEWIVSFDYASLYPSLIRAFNFCPSTYIEERYLNDELKQLRAKYVSGSNEFKILEQMELTQEQKDEMHEVLSKYNVTLSPAGHFFRKDKEGVMPYLMGKIYSDRKIAKKKMIEAEKKLRDTSDESEKEKLRALASKFDNEQMALKIAINSAYGALGNAHFILAKKAVAESITAGGRFYDRKTKYEVDKVLSSKFNYDREPGCQADTDSVYFYLEPIIQKNYPDKGDVETADYLDKKVIPIIDGIIQKKVLDDISYQRNLMVPEVMVMDREVIASKGIMVGKKNYTLNVLDNEGIKYEGGKKKIVGLNIKKTNLPEFIREKMLVFLDLLYDGDEKKFQKILKEFKAEFESLDVKDIAFPKGVKFITDKNRPGIRDMGGGRYHYTLGTSGVPVHVRASLLYNEYIDRNDMKSVYDNINHGDKMKFVYLKIPNDVGDTVVGFPNDIKHGLFLEKNDLKKNVDYKKMFEGIVIKPLDPLVKALEWDFEETIKLTDFF